MDNPSSDCGGSRFTATSTYRLVKYVPYIIHE